MMYRLVLLISAFFTLFTGQVEAGAGKSVPAGFKGSFIENKGQWDSNIRFKADLPYGSLFLEDKCLTFCFLDDKTINTLLSYKFRQEKTPGPGGDLSPYVPAHAYKIKFGGANTAPSLAPAFPYPDYMNYFLENDPSRWTSRVNHYNEVTYKELYKGIDLQLKQEDEKLKYTFIVQPGARTENISMIYEGIEAVKIKSGRLLIKTTVNQIEELAPVAWQTDESGNRQFVKCKFIVNDNAVSFRFPEGYNETKPLVIDPVLVFSSYSGSPVDNWGYTATYDNKGFLYAGGVAFMIGYPTVTGSYQLNYGGGSSDIVISKYDTTGSFMVYSTYLGGSGTEVPASLIVNNNNDLFVLGCTGSADFPVTGQSFDQSFNGGTAYTLTSILHYPNGSDIVISKLSADGTELLSSTYFGGNGNDGLNTFPPLKHNYADDARGEIKIDQNQNIYVISSTQSTNLPVSPTAYQPSFGGVQDACIVKFDPTLTYLLWSTYLGGSEADAGYSLVLDENDHVYAAGGTKSADFPVTPQTVQQVFQGGGCDGYVSCLGDNGSNLLYSTYVGSTAYDQVYFVDRDKLGNIYILGQTAASGMTFIFNAAWSVPGGGQFISKFHPDLSGVVYSTTFGTGNGGPDISPTAFMVDNCNYVYVSGWGGLGLNGFGGTAGLAITGNAFQTTTDGKDYYFMVMRGDASGLVYGTFFGGLSSEHVDGGTSRFDKKGRIYQSVCAGCGGLDDFPTTPGAWSNVNGSTNCNNGVIKFDFKIPLAVADFIRPPAGCAPYELTFQNTSFTPNPQTAQYNWDFDDGSLSTQNNPVHTFQNPGTYHVTLILTDTGSCNYSDTLHQTVTVLGLPPQTLASQVICKGESVQLGINPIPDPSLSYTWFPSTDLNNASISNPFATPAQTTEYYLLITNGVCSDTILQKVRVYDLKVNAGNDTIICSQTLHLVAKANEDSLFYLWSTNPLFTDTLNTSLLDSNVIVSLQDQSNWFYIRIFNNYCSALDSIHVSFSILVSPGGGQNPVCPDSCDGIAAVEILGGTPPYQYLWNTGQTVDTLSNLCAGTYTVTVTDSVHCVSVATIPLVDPPDILINTVITDIPCAEVCIGQIATTVTGGTNPYNYLWSDGEVIPDLTNLCTGNYSLSVTDAHNCPAIKQCTVDINTIFVNIHTSVSPDTIYQGLSSQLQVNSLPGCTYTWFPTQGLSDPGISNPLATPSATTSYQVTISDPFECQYTDSVKVIVKEVICREPYIFIPNGFSPNGDNKNDILLIQGKVIETLAFSIYDRWGNRVFETTDLNQGWDGNFKGKQCEPGVYVYHAEVGCFNKEIFKKKGNITLIR